VTAYCGCVGDDDSAAKLKAENEKAGVRSVYMINAGGKTGSCAVLLTKSVKGEPLRYILLIPIVFPIVTIPSIGAYSPTSSPPKPFAQIISRHLKSTLSSTVLHIFT